MSENRQHHKTHHSTYRSHDNRMHHKTHLHMRQHSIHSIYVANIEYHITVGTILVSLKLNDLDKLQHSSQKTSYLHQHFLETSAFYGYDHVPALPNLRLTHYHSIHLRSHFFTYCSANCSVHHVLTNKQNNVTKPHIQKLLNLLGDFSYRRSRRRCKAQQDRADFFSGPPFFSSFFSLQIYSTLFLHLLGTVHKNKFY